MFQKHFSLTLDIKLNCLVFLNIFLPGLPKIISAHHILNIYWRLDYDDVIQGQGQLYNSSFHEKLESIQYNACLATTGAIRKQQQELDLQSLKSRFCFRKLCYSYKIFSGNYPSYLYRDLIPNLNRVQNYKYIFAVITRDRVIHDNLKR